MNTTIRLLTGCVLSLVLLGALALDSAAVAQATPYRLHAHFAWLVVGLTCAAAFAWIPYARLQGWSGQSQRWPLWLSWLAQARLPHLLLGLALLQLVLVLVPPFSEVRNGARRWPIWGGQPSEFAKLALILALADDLARRPLRLGAGFTALARPGAWAGAVALLIFLEPDWGGAVLILIVAFALLWLAGAGWFHVLSAGVILGLLGVHGLLMNPHRLGRVLSFSDPEAYQFGAGFQQWRSLLAIASGGWSGRLLGEGRFKSGYVPEQETDFIFSLLAEEVGFLGVTGVILLYVVLVVCGWRVAARTRDPFGQYLAAGITFWIALQALIHLGVNTSLLPNKGLPLPLVSYGGSNLVCLLAAVGMLASVARYAPRATRLEAIVPHPGQWVMSLRRLWHLVRGRHPRPIRHAYQLPPTGSRDPRRAVVVLRAATRKAAAASRRPPAWDGSLPFRPPSSAMS